MFTIDTGVLFPETYETWRKIEDRYGLRVEVMDATPPNGTPWSAANCCGQRKVDALDEACGATAEEIVAAAVERHHPNLVLACSFHKEESVLIDMLMGIKPSARVFTIDTGVLFPDTFETWRKIDDRYGCTWSCSTPRRPTAPPERLQLLRPRSRWTRSIARSPARMPGSPASGASSRPRAPTRDKVELTESSRGVWKFNPLVDWSDADVWRYVHEHDLPYHPLHDQGYASIGCAPCTSPGNGREGRWAGQEKTECGLHV